MGDVYPTRAEDEVAKATKQFRVEDHEGRSVQRDGREDNIGYVEGAACDPQLPGSIVCAKGSKGAQGTDPGRVR